MRKIFVGVVLSVLIVANVALAANFSAPVKVGEIGFPAQAPYSGFIVDGATQNDGIAHAEEFERNGKPLTTYTRGIARFGKLCCRYDFDADIADAMQFGGADNFVLTTGGEFKEIFSIGNDAGLELYAIYHNYCVTDLKVLGACNGKWRVCIDSKKISDKFFGGADAYKLDGGILYDVPKCAGNALIVVYRRWHWGGESAPEGEFRFTWNAAAENFGVEQIVY